MSFVATLEPTGLWKHFDAILAIPRASKNEENMRRHVASLANGVGFVHAIDSAGNIVVRKPGTTGHEGAPVTILQSHLDMVTEKNADVEHDFTKDPIIPRMDDGYIKATGTTLGSDNGIGVATMLAVMEATDLVHGPLELLFTIDEETGLTGAAQLDSNLLNGRQLINLDSEEEGVLYVGCAGGGDTQLTLEVSTAQTGEGDTAFTIALTGLRGGHSGCDIHLQRGNAVGLLARVLWSAYVDTPFRLARFGGGSAHNAIPREAFATVVVSRPGRVGLGAAVEREFGSIRAEFRSADPDMQLAISDESTTTAWDLATTETLLRLLNGLPHGVAAMSADIPELVETSVNLATVRQNGRHLTIGVSSRSSIDSALEAMQRRVRAVGLLAGAAVEDAAAYPGWKPNLDSRLLRVVADVHRLELGAEPEVKAIHAGLECGIIGRKVPGIDMISFGPVIEFPHSPDERVLVDSVGRFYRLLVATLARIAKDEDKPGG